jgi:hypothetical protein
MDAGAWVGIGRCRMGETEERERERGLAGTHGQNDPELATTKEIGPQAATPQAANVLRTLGHDQAYIL